MASKGNFTAKSRTQLPSGSNGIVEEKADWNRYLKPSPWLSNCYPSTPLSGQQEIYKSARKQG